MADDQKPKRRVLSITPDALSAEELRVAKLLTSGCWPDSIARAMEISREAVDDLCRSIYGTLGTSDRETLSRWATYYDIGRW